MASACSIRVRGVVQGVGFRPFVYRLALANTLNGWVLNAEEGVEIHLEGAETGLEAFVRDLKAQPPPAASIAEIDVQPAEPVGLHEFTIRDKPAPGAPDGSHFARPAGLRRLSERTLRPRRSALSVSLHQLHQLRPALHRRAGSALRPAQHHHERLAARRLLRRGISDPGNRRFHAQPVACPACGPGYYLYRSLTDRDQAADAKRRRHPPGGRASSRRRDSRRERSRRIPSGVRRPESRCRRGVAGSQVPQRKTLRPDGARYRAWRALWSSFLPKRKRC